MQINPKFILRALDFDSDYLRPILIVQNGEELVDLRNLNYSRISAMEGCVVLKAHERPEDIDPRARKHYFGYGKGDLQIKLFEGLRDLATQKKLFDTKKEAIKKAHTAMIDLSYCGYARRVDQL